MKWVETKTGFFSGGCLHSMSSTWEFLTFAPLNMWQKLRLGGTIFLASKLTNWRRLEQIPVTTWLRRWSGRGAFESIWMPLLRSKLGEAYRRTSAAFIWAHISRMYKARRTGLKREMFGYVPGGYGRVLDRMAQTLAEAGVEIRVGARVQSAVADGPAVRVAFGADEFEEFDRVVFTVPAPLVAQSCPTMDEEECERFADVEYLGIACASLLLRKPLSPYYVTNITDAGIPFTAVIEMTTIVDPAELGGHSLVYLPKYIAADDELYHASDESLQEQFLAALEKMHPQFSRDDVLAFKIARTRFVMALPTLNYSQRLPPMKTSVPGIYVVTSAHILKGNLNVNETIQIAEEAMEGVLGDALAECDADLNYEPVLQS